MYSEWKGLKLTGRTELFLEETETKRGDEEKRAGVLKMSSKGAEGI